MHSSLVSSLIFINSCYIDWDQVNERHTCFGIKKALMANMWFFNEDMKNHVTVQEGFRDVQLIILKKIKVYYKSITYHFYFCLIIKLHLKA